MVNMKLTTICAILYYALLHTLPIAKCAYSEENYKSRYEYKYSFKGPNLSRPEKGIPFWSHLFDTVPGEDQVRVVPSLKAKYGAVWTKNSFPFKEWKVEISFRIQGRGRIGADGFALWYVETPNGFGPVFGSQDNWKGLGVFFDSYDNDGKKNNPYISILVNNGTMSYDHANDGLGQIQGGCFRDFRNRPYPVKAKLVYTDNELELYIDPGNTPITEYEFCTVIKDVDLPKEYYFGISAATGALADDHDILKFLTWSLQKKSEEDQSEPIDEDAKKKEEDEKKLQEEYDKNLQEFYTEQKKFKEEHPDKVKEEPVSPEELFQGSSSAELQAVFDVQNKIKQQVMDLSKSLILVMEKQDKVVTKLEQYKPPDIDLAKSHQIENVSKMQRTTNDAINELKDHISFLKSTTNSISESVSKMGGVKREAANPYESEKQLDEVLKKLETVYKGIADLDNKQKIQQQIVCPELDLPSCVSTPTLIAVCFLQVFIIIAYQSFKQSRENAAKKFF